MTTPRPASAVRVNPNGARSHQVAAWLDDRQFFRLELFRQEQKLSRSDALRLILNSYFS